MILFDITYVDGTQDQEYGNDEDDVRRFLILTYPERAAIASIVPTL